MNINLLRGLAAVPGIPMLINAVGFVTDPSQVAATLGMPLLEGVGRSTQVGDFGAFFLSLTGFIFYGAFAVKPAWIRAAAIMLALAALLRVVAWLFHGADFASLFIAVEVILTIWLLVFGTLLERHARSGQP